MLMQINLCQVILTDFTKMAEKDKHMGIFLQRYQQDISIFWLFCLSFRTQVCDPDKSIAKHWNTNTSHP